MQPWAHHQVHIACQQTFQGMFLAPCHHNCNVNMVKVVYAFWTSWKWKSYKIILSMEFILTLLLSLLLEPTKGLTELSWNHYLDLPKKKCKIRYKYGMRKNVANHYETVETTKINPLLLFIKSKFTVYICIHFFEFNCSFAIYTV